MSQDSSHAVQKLNVSIFIINEVVAGQSENNQCNLAFEGLFGANSNVFIYLAIFANKVVSGYLKNQPIHDIGQMGHRIENRRLMDVTHDEGHRYREEITPSNLDA